MLPRSPCELVFDVVAWKKPSDPVIDNQERWECPAFAEGTRRLTRSEREEGWPSSLPGVPPNLGRFALIVKALRPTVRVRTPWEGMSSGRCIGCWKPCPPRLRARYVAAQKEACAPASLAPGRKALERAWYTPGLTRRAKVC